MRHEDWVPGVKDEYSRIKHAPLKIADRCDQSSCGAQAFVRVFLSAGCLDFCDLHHPRQVPLHLPGKDRDGVAFEARSPFE